ncbi:exopolysaccharide Pel transporter PelG [Vibrio sp. PP-XX7]
MAGIGFEIRKILKKDSLLSLFEAYGYAGIIGSGPWLLSILALMSIGFISLGVVLPKVLIVQFLISVTYMMAGSLILTGIATFTHPLCVRLIFSASIRTSVTQFTGIVACDHHHGISHLRNCMALYSTDANKQNPLNRWFCLPV